MIGLCGERENWNYCFIADASLPRNQEFFLTKSESQNIFFAKKSQYRKSTENFHF